ncbi:MAG: PAS domain-containing protein [Rhodomicrobium sp.]
MGVARFRPLSHHAKLYGYWLTKRRSRRLPARSELDPADIPELLPYLIIVGKESNQFRYRLVGTAVVQAVGYDATGSTVGSYLLAPKHALEAQAIFERAFTLAHPIFATGGFILKSGADATLSLLVLPLSDDGAAVNMTISTLVARFDARRMASRDWLSGMPIKVCDIVDVRSAEHLGKLCLEWEQRLSSGPANEDLCHSILAQSTPPIP